MPNDLSNDTPAGVEAAGLTRADRVRSYLVGAALVVAGAAMLAGFGWIERAPGKLFFLLGAGGVGSVLTGLGLAVHPLDRRTWDAMRQPGGAFKVAPPFWKVWFFLTAVAMIGAVVYVSQVTVRIPRGD